MLLHRLGSTTLPRGKGAPRLIAGLIPEAVPPDDESTRRALTERADIIWNRARTLAETAITAREPWTVGLGSAPSNPVHAEAWRRLASTVAAYRDRYQVAGAAPLGAETPEDWPRTRDRDLARRALARAVQFQESAAGRPRPHESPALEVPAPGL